jgi:hypothetical protein
VILAIKMIELIKIDQTNSFNKSTCDECGKAYKTMVKVKSDLKSSHNLILCEIDVPKEWQERVNRLGVK